MDGAAELVEVHEFLAAHAPFDELPQAELRRLVGEIRIEYFRRGTTLIARGADSHHLYVLRSGAADLKDQDGELVERSDAGATFGSITLTQGNPSTLEVVAIEDSLAYLLPDETFYRLVRDHPAVARFFSDQRAARMRPAVDALSSPTTGDAVLRIRVADLMRREPVCATASTTIRDAAAIMAAQGVSALLIVDGDRLTGIITDRDLRSRVLAAGLEPTRPVSEVMTPDPITASPDALAFEAMLAMVGRTIHHLPLVADGRPGLDADRDRVLSIGWVPVDGCGVVLAGARYRIVRPEDDEPVGPSATVHGLTDDDVAAGVPLADAVAELLADLAGRILLVHFARIEAEFLGRACQRLCGAGLPWPVIDTLQLEHRLVTTAWQPDPPAGALRLWAARERYGLPRTGPHHALTDAVACAELYLAQVAELGGGRPLALRRLLAR